MSKIATMSRKLIDTASNNNPQFSNLMDDMARLGNLVLLGGAVRDAYLYGTNKMPRDFDFVMLDADQQGIRSMLSENDWTYETNRYGGFKVLAGDIEVDVWDIHSTWAFQNKRVAPVALDALPATTFLSIDAIAFNLSDGAIYERGFLHSLQERTIDIVLEENPFPNLNVMRALHFARRMKFGLSPELRDYLRHQIMNHPDPLPMLRRLEVSRYGEATIDEKMLAKCCSDDHGH